MRRRSVNDEAPHESGVYDDHGGEVDAGFSGGGRGSHDHSDCDAGCAGLGFRARGARAPR